MGTSLESKATNKIFIVHGHDLLALREVERIIGLFGLEPVILNEKAHQGETLIEKLETHSEVGFAIVILSADDEGKAKGDHAYLPRSRQNVIAELGYFIGKLGRQHVCSLYLEGVEIPTDFRGLGYVPMDSAGAWKQVLFKELTAVGYTLDTSLVAKW